MEKSLSSQHKILIAAPMAGISNRPFRRLMRKYGSDISVSELISAKGLIFGGKKTLKLIQTSDDERPVGIQLFGEDEASMIDGGKIVQDAGADFVDINFGCPVPKVVKRGAGAGWSKRIVELGSLLSNMVNSLSIPVTIKIRTGWDDDSRNAIEFCRIAYESGITWVAIHGRTRCQGYQGLADWDYLNEVVEKSKIPIIGNGDILTKSDLLKRSSTFKGMGLMIGRGILHDPLLLIDDTNTSFLEVFNDYMKFAEEDFDQHYLLSQGKKIAAWYSSGIPNSSYFRKNIFQLKSVDTLLEYSREFLALKSAHSRSQAPTLLMGGHG